MNGTHEPFSDRDLQALLGLLREADELESPLRSAAHPALARTHGAARFDERDLKPSGGPRIGRPTILGLRSPRWAAAAVAAAACGVAWFSQSTQPNTSRRPATLAAATPRVVYSHEVTPGGETQKHCLSATWAEPLSILAVLRTWSSDCQCLVWDLYEFDGQSPVTRTRMNESLQVTATVEAAELPPVDQVLVFAMARDRRDLPQSSDESANFLECLLEASPVSDASAKVDQYARVVSSCLPDSVDVLPHLLARP